MRSNNYFCFFLMIFLLSIQAKGFGQDVGQYSLSREPQGLIHLAEVGTVVDTVNVWGDVTQTGRFVIPRNLNIPELLSYAGGIGGRRNNSQELEWVKKKIIIQINRFKPGEGQVEVKSFVSDYKKSLPPELFTYDLQNEDIVSIQVQRKPNFWDYLGRVSPIIGIVTSGIVLYNQFN